MQNKTIGLIGGIGWASSAEYYRLLNEMTLQRRGPQHSARLIMCSLDQYDFTSRAAQADQKAIENFLLQQVDQLKAAGADFFLLCANGAHRFVPAIASRLPLPFISIVDETVKQVQLKGIKKVGLLGVKQTMSGRFYHDKLDDASIETITPELMEQELIHQIIYEELIHNRITEKSRQYFIAIMKNLVATGAEGIILGCTEIPLIVQQEHSEVTIFNTTAIHCEAALEYAFSSDLG